MIPVSTRPSTARLFAFFAAESPLKIRTAANFLTTLFVSTFFAAALPAAASATCLSVLNENGVTYWVNHCSVPVSVNWNDEGDCTNWNCSDSVGPNSRETTDVKGDVNWCECQGDECSVFGPPPCKASLAEPDDQQSQDVDELKQHLLDEKKKSALNDQTRRASEEELQAEEQDNIRRYSEIQAAQEKQREMELNARQNAERQMEQHRNATNVTSSCKNPQRFQTCIRGQPSYHHITCWVNYCCRYSGPLTKETFESCASQMPADLRP